MNARAAGEAPHAGRRGSGRPGARLRRARRGFTLIELMAVMAIIGILAAVASPTFIQLVRDQRVSRCAMEIADLYRLARSRALGRGSAVLVRWTAGGGVSGKGLVEIREAITPGALVPTPSTSCSTTDWTDASLVSRHVYNFDPGNGAYELAQINFFDELGGAEPVSEMCFTPRGRTFIRYNIGAPFVQLAGVPSYTVVNTSTNRVRTVFVPPNGVARVAL
ncbi:MAG TPA: prepilin-type N-terminal cleavage/methylation domain-containing protein [Minicystis sp.]|nr:prepilin-type N-terminal cleavage/methylation domain-containing protein [Minicystis sp.]